MSGVVPQRSGPRTPSTSFYVFSFSLRMGTWRRWHEVETNEAVVTAAVRQPGHAVTSVEEHPFLLSFGADKTCWATTTLWAWTGRAGTTCGVVGRTGSAPPLSVHETWSNTVGTGGGRLVGGPAACAVCRAQWRGGGDGQGTPRGADARKPGPWTGWWGGGQARPIGVREGGTDGRGGVTLGPGLAAGLYRAARRDPLVGTWLLLCYVCAACRPHGVTRVVCWPVALRGARGGSSRRTHLYFAGPHRCARSVTQTVGGVWRMRTRWACGGSCSSAPGVHPGRRSPPPAGGGGCALSPHRPPDGRCRAAAVAVVRCCRACWQQHRRDGMGNAVGGERSHKEGGGDR